MKLATIPAEEAIALLRSLGLTIGQAGIYGPTHNVTQHAARAVFPELEHIIAQYGALEITLRENKLLVNGTILDVGGSSGKNLLDRMTLHKVEGIAFLSPPNLDEFLNCITLFGTSPMALAATGGFETAMKNASLRSVQVVNVQYRRVSKDQSSAAKKSDPDHPETPRVPRRPSLAKSTAGILDLAAHPDASADATGSIGNGASISTFEETRRQAVAARQQRSTALAGLLRKAATLLEQEVAAEQEPPPEDISAAFNQIRDMLATITTSSERQIKTFAGQITADSQTIQDIESAARRRGIGLQLTRNELVTHYAELTQELAQPLTVSSGVLDMLNSGRVGELTDSQRELLKMAGESIEQVNRLVDHLKQISGMPESLTPDANILNEAYKK